MIRPLDLRDDEAWEMFGASREGDLGLVTTLAERRPELVQREYNYTPPLHFAVREGHLPVTRYLLDHGAVLDYHTYPFRDSLLTMARDRGHEDVAELLLALASKQFPVVEGIGGFLDAA